MKEKMSKKDILICFLPLLALFIVKGQYQFVPNFREFSSFEASRPTALFLWVNGAMAALFLALLVLGIYSQGLRKRIRKAAPILTVVILLVLAYDVATLTTGWLPQPFFPWPDAILNAIVNDWSLLLTAMRHSMVLLFSGYLIGVACGIVTGICAGWFPKFRYWVQPLVRTLGSIPSITWLPIIMIAASSLFSGAVFLIALSVWYPVTVTTMNGVLSVPKGIFEAASTFGVSKIGMVFKVALPASMPFIFNGLVQGMSIACTALLIAEMMGVEAGLGAYINWQRGWAQFAGMYGAILIICLTFLAVNLGLSQLRSKALHWKEGEAL